MSACLIKTLLGLSLLTASFGAAQSTAPAAPTTPVAPSMPASPKPQSTPPKAPGVSAVTSPTVSSAVIMVSRTIKAQLISCPKTLKVSPQAVCLYAKNSAEVLRPQIKATLGEQAKGDWKLTGTAGSLIVAPSGQDKAGAYILISALAAQESLVIVDALKVAAAPSSKMPTPLGAVKGEAYVLDTDLVGLVTITPMGSGQYRLSVLGQSPLIVTVNSKAAQRADGKVELAFAPLSDGQRLLLPLANLRALGCTYTTAAKGVTVACGSESLGVMPIYF